MRIRCQTSKHQPKFAKTKETCATDMVRLSCCCIQERGSYSLTKELGVQAYFVTGQHKCFVRYPSMQGPHPKKPETVQAVGFFGGQAPQRQQQPLFADPALGGGGGGGTSCDSLSCSCAICAQVDRHQVSQLTNKHAVVAIETFWTTPAFFSSGLECVCVVLLTLDESALDTRRTHCCNSTEGTSKKGESPSK